MIGDTRLDEILVVVCNLQQIVKEWIRLRSRFLSPIIKFLALTVIRHEPWWWEKMPLNISLNISDWKTVAKTVADGHWRYARQLFDLFSFVQLSDCKYAHINRIQFTQCNYTIIHTALAVMPSHNKGKAVSERSLLIPASRKYVKQKSRLLQRYYHYPDPFRVARPAVVRKTFRI